MHERFVHRCRSRRYSPIGGRRQPIYKRIKREDGTVYLDKVGETDTQDLIDSYADECDINRIIRRYTAGDSSVLARMQGVYFDASGTPTDLTTAFEAVSHARDYYNQLPLAVQREFGSLGGFLSAIRTVEDSTHRDPNPKKEVNPNE